MCVCVLGLGLEVNGVDGILATFYDLRLFLQHYLTLLSASRYGWCLKSKPHILLEC